MRLAQAESLIALRLFERRDLELDLARDGAPALCEFGEAVQAVAPAPFLGAFDEHVFSPEREPGRHRLDDVGQQSFAVVDLGLECACVRDLVEAVPGFRCALTNQVEAELRPGAQEVVDFPQRLAGRLPVTATSRDDRELEIGREPASPFLEAILPLWSRQSDAERSHVSRALLQLRAVLVDGQETGERGDTAGQDIDVTSRVLNVVEERPRIYGQWNRG